ncbi:hypothetical protein HY797_04230 [Candidatus Falkowbacteria bacterium]|nr:hypothetical protein [Candidatus Falkowbacteria bacterium]
MVVMRTKIFAVTVMVVFLAGTVAFAEMAGLPSDQSLVKSGGDWSGEVTIRTDKVGGALVEVPIASSQSGTPRLYRSYARASNNVWAQSTDGKYEIATNRQVAQPPVSFKRPGHFFIRNICLQCLRSQFAVSWF